MVRRSRKAFTLIELLLVLVILAVLASVVVPKFVGRSQEAKIGAAKADISHFSTALDTFEQDNGRYPTSEEGLAALVNPPAGAKDHQNLDRLPNDPWGSPYIYIQPGIHNTRSFDLMSYGPDQHEGGGDDITNWSESGQ